MKRLMLLPFLFATVWVYGKDEGEKEDNLSYTYDVRKMAYFLDDKEVPYYIVVDTLSWKLKPNYILIGGLKDKREAIKQCGEKYREGIFILKTNKEYENAENKK